MEIKTSQNGITLKSKLGTPTWQVLQLNVSDAVIQNLHKFLKLSGVHIILTHEPNHASNFNSDDGVSEYW